jgi:hypothetical protein
LFLFIICLFFVDFTEYLGNFLSKSPNHWGFLTKKQSRHSEKFVKYNLNRNQ